MLFRKDLEKRCAYCQHAAMAGENRMACCKRGIVPPSYSCRRFSYDPLKRVPPRPREPDFQKYEEKDYSL
jgi:hypothetical protein